MGLLTLRGCERGLQNSTKDCICSCKSDAASSDSCTQTSKYRRVESVRRPAIEPVLLNLQIQASCSWAKACTITSPFSLLCPWPNTHCNWSKHAQRVFSSLGGAIGMLWWATYFDRHAIAGVHKNESLISCRHKCTRILVDTGHSGFIGTRVAYLWAMSSVVLMIACCIHTSEPVCQAAKPTNMDWAGS